MSSKGILGAILAHIESGLLVLRDDVVADLKSLKAEAVADVDALVTHLTPYAVTGAKEVEDAVQSGAILASEKRSQLVTKLESQAQAAGYDLKQQGVAAAINLALEFGVNLFKMLIGQALGAPENQPADDPKPAA